MRRPPVRHVALALAVPFVAAGATVYVAQNLGGWSGSPQAQTYQAGPGPSTPRIRSVVALGDSVPSGTNCDCTPYPSLLARDLQRRTNTSVGVVNLSVGGLTSEQVEAQLNDDTDARRAVRGADVVLVTAGANDLQDLAHPDGCDEKCVNGMVDEATRRVGSIVTSVRHLSPEARVLVTTYWNVLADGDAVPDDASKAWTDHLTRTFNASLTRQVQRAGGQLVDLYAPFKGDGSVNPTPLLAEDGDHPNARGHQLIEKTLLTALDGPTAPTGTHT